MERDGKKSSGRSFLKAILDTALSLGGPPLSIILGPPTMGNLIVRVSGTLPATVGLQLVPRLGRKDVVDDADVVVLPDGVVDAGPAEGLEGVVDVGEGDPAGAEEVAEEALVGEVHVGGAALHVGDDLGVEGLGRVDDLQAAVHVAEGAGGGGVRARVLGQVRGGVLGGEGAVGGYPVGGVVGFAERVADAGVAGGEDAGAGGLVGWVGGDGRVVEGQGHEVVDVLADEHVGVELDDAGVLGEAEGGELGPAVVEARVVRVVAALGGEEVLDALFRDAPAVDGFVGRGRDRVGVEGDEGVAGAMFAERVVEGEEAG